MVKQFYTSQELSELLGITVRAVNDRAKRQHWDFRKREGRGGGKEWNLERLPKDLRESIAAAVASRIAQANAKKYPAIAPVLFTVNTLTQVPERKRERAAARALLVSMAREFQKASGSPRTNAYETFCHEYNRGALETPEWVRGLVPSACRKSLTNWEDAILQKGRAAVTGRQGLHRIGSGIIDSTRGMADCIVAEIIEFYEVSAASVMEALEARFEGQRLPTLRSLQRWMSKYREQNAQVIMKIQNPDGWRNKFQSAAGSRSANIERVNQLWELDSSPTDVILAGGVRYTLLGGIDVATRRGALHLAKTSSAQGVCSLLRRALRNFGVPESIKMDNGSDYTSSQVTTAVFDLGIKPDWCTPFSPDEKPHIERFFKTFQHGFCVRLAGFIGHCVADRKAIESRRSFAERVSRKEGKKDAMEFRYTPEEFQAICDAWVEDNYNERVHSELGMSPNDAAAKIGGTVRRITDERALDILLLPLAGNQGMRVVGKKGLRVDGGVYNAPQLGGLEGTEVQVRCDEHDAGYVYAFDLDGLFICRAEDPDLTGVSLRELALARKAHQKAVINRKVKEAKKIVAEVRPQETAAMILDLKARQAAEKRAARAEGQTADYTTPALNQAAFAAMSATHLPAEPETELEAAAREALATELSAPPAQAPAQTIDDLSGREAFWMALKLEERLKRRESLTPEETRWLIGYQGTNYYRTWRDMYDDFGAAMFDGMDAVAL